MKRLLIVLLLALILVVFFYLRQGKESELIEKKDLREENEYVEIALLEPLMETDDWKTFANRAGWSIKYPPDWRVSGCHYCTMEDLVDPEGYVSFSPPRPSGDSLPLGYYEAFLMISHLADKPKSLSTKDRLKEISHTMIWPPHIKEEFVTLNGLSSFRVLWRANSGDEYMGSWQEDIFLIYNETETFQLSFGGSQVHEKLEDYPTYPIYRQMISTFKFKTDEF